MFAPLVRIQAAISVHSYGNVLIFPWGYSEEQHPEKYRLSKMAYKIVNAIKWTTNEFYVPGTAYEVQLIARIYPFML